MHIIMRAGATLAAVLTALTVAPANATVVTKTYYFESDPVNSYYFTPPPRSVVRGQFTITLDDALEFYNRTTGVTLDALNIPLGSAFAVNHWPSIPFISVKNTFQIGGLQNTVNVTTMGTDDFFLEFTDEPGEGPRFRNLGYVRAGVPDGFFSFSGRVSTTPIASGVPEPGTWAMMIGGFGFAGSAFRRARKNGQALKLADARS